MWWFISARWRANFFPLQVQSVVGVWHSCTPTPQAPTLTYPLGPAQLSLSQNKPVKYAKGKEDPVLVVVS